MDIIEFRELCLSLPNVEESTPFDQTTLVYKIGGKLFALASMECFDHFAVKCEPARAELLREKWRGVRPAWHMNKRHWNDIFVDSDLSFNSIQAELFGSYDLVLRGSVTPKSERNRLLAQWESSEFYTIYITDLEHFEELK